MKAIRPRHG